MKSYFFLLFIFLVTLTSCKDESVQQVETNSRKVVPFYQNVAPANDPATNVPVAEGMNPQHGQPGHRCDIAVGAPLNSQAAAPMSNTNSQQNNQPQNAPAPNNTENNPAAPTAKGVNPPHGQQNHRCDLAVGAPLPVQ